jgi:putative Mn2+ efflux pump MntP
MTALIIGSIILSLLHATIPNHWLPVIAIGRKENWTLREVSYVTLIAAAAHGLSTVAIGIVLSILGSAIAEHVTAFTHWIAPVILIVLGIFFIYRHYLHKHFHIEQSFRQKISKKQIIVALVAAMFFSPCMEIEAYFLLGGSYGVWVVVFMAIVYLVITITGMVFLVRLAYRELLKWNWHRIEHNAGIITGVVLVLTGIIAFFVS